MDVLQEILLRLGEIHGAVESIAKRQEELTRWLDGLDTRLRAVEVKAALWGAIGGSSVTAVVHLLRQ